LELVSRNVADAAPPPPATSEEVEILSADQLAIVLDALKGSRIYPVAALAIATGMRRGELLALQWRSLDLDKGTVAIERSLEQTKAGLSFKSPKTKSGRRKISLPQSAVTLLREHRKAQLELRMQLGMGRPQEDALVFPADHEGKPFVPTQFSMLWLRQIR